MTTSPFNKLLKEALEASKKVEHLEAQRKLSAKAFLRDALKLANTSHEKLNLLETALENPIMQRSQQFYRSSLKLLKEPVGCSCFPTEPRRLTWLCLGREDELYAELNMADSDIFKLFALAVRTATKKWPETFGTIEDMDAHKKALKEAIRTRDELYKEIEVRYTPLDLRIGEHDKEGRAQVTFAVSGGEVPIGSHAGERLVGWLKVHPEATKAL